MCSQIWRGLSLILWNRYSGVFLVVLWVPANFTDDKVGVMGGLLQKGDHVEISVLGILLFAVRLYIQITLTKTDQYLQT